MNSLIGILVVVLAVSVGCQSKPSGSAQEAPAAKESAATVATTAGAKPTAEQCEQAAAKLVELAKLQAEDSDDDERQQFLAALPQIGEVFRDECNATAWSPAAIACVLAAATVADGEKCSALFPKPSSNEPVEIDLDKEAPAAGQIDDKGDE